MRRDVYVFSGSLAARAAGALGAFVLAAVVFGCAAVGPDYSPPEPGAPEAWSAELSRGLTPGPAEGEDLARWWTVFGDPVLDRLMERAVEGNRDLKAARARLREARARRGIAGAGLFPTVDATGSASYGRSSANAGSGEESELYSVGFDASWEIDLFGRLRRSVEAADADLEAAGEDLGDTLVTLLSEVALNYTEARLFQARLDIAGRNLATQEETYSITRSLAEAGLTSSLDVERARLNLESTRALIPDLRAGLERARNRLAVLVGATPAELGTTLSSEGPVPAAGVGLAVGVPADTLRRRPDVRRAERRLAARTARVGVATAELYPVLTLPGSVGLRSVSTDDLFTADSRTWGLTPSLRWRVLDFGAVRRAIDVEDALTGQALAAYESAVLAAVEEVENALVDYVQEHSRRAALAEASGAAVEAAELSDELYRAGMIDFLDVLDAQRSRLSLEDQLAVSEAEVTTNLIRIYKALGGGWLRPGVEVSGHASGAEKE